MAVEKTGNGKSSSRKQPGSLAITVIVAIGCAGLMCAVQSVFFVPRIAYVESGKMIANFSEAIKARNLFEEEKGQWEKDLKVIEDSLNTALGNLKSQYEKSGGEKKKQLAASLEKWNTDYARYARIIEQKKITREQELMQPAIDKINKYMEVWGHDHHYDVIFGTMAGGNIIQANKKLDVTMEALHDLNEHYKSK